MKSMCKQLNEQINTRLRVTIFNQVSKGTSNQIYFNILRQVYTPLDVQMYKQVKQNISI